MKKPAYYNENDKHAAKWLRNLIAAGHIAPGDVDERSIEDVRPNELRGYAQCHFFAGIGVWSAALRQAGWEDHRQVWTGSCPCQPFSAAGEGKGFADERHLWPAWNHLIEECGPGVVFGEQVASKDGLDWLDLVSADLEGQGYAFVPVDLCAAGVGAPHIRQRLFFVADASYDRLQRGLSGRSHPKREIQYGQVGRGGAVGRMDDARRNDGQREEPPASDWEPQANGPADQLGGSSVSPIWLDDAIGHRRGARRDHYPEHDGQQLDATSDIGNRPSPTNGPWRDADWLFCKDGKWRPVEPGTFPLAHGSFGRVGRLRAYGNAINQEVAATFIQAYRDCVDSL